MMLRSTLSLAAVLLAGSTLAAQDLKSGPDIGQPRTKFISLFLNGPKANKKLCPI